MAYQYGQSITVQAGKVAATLTNFTVCINLTSGGSGVLATLATVANGGVIQNTATVNGQTVPTDLIFTSDSAGATLLKWEIESYNATTGALVAWVLIASLSSSVNTTFYMFAGNSAITTFQGGAVGSAWDANYLSIQHFANGSSLSLLDSTSNGNNGTASTNAPTAGSGQIDGAAAMVTASTEYVGLGSAINPTAITLSAWVKATSFPNAYNSVISRVGSGTNDAQILVKSTGAVAVYFASSGGTMGGHYDPGSHTLSAGTWYYLTLTYSSAAGLIGYVNAVSDGTSPAEGSLVTTPAPTQVGGDPFTSGRTWNGLIDEARTSSIARAATWITTEYNNQSSPGTFYTLASTADSLPWMGAHKGPAATFDDPAQPGLVFKPWISSAVQQAIDSLGWLHRSKPLTIEDLLYPTASEWRPWFDHASESLQWLRRSAPLVSDDLGTAGAAAWHPWLTGTIAVSPDSLPWLRRGALPAGDEAGRAGSAVWRPWLTSTVTAAPDSLPWLRRGARFDAEAELQAQVARWRPWFTVGATVDSLPWFARRGSGDVTFELIGRPRGWSPVLTGTVADGLGWLRRARDLQDDEAGPQKLAHWSPWLTSAPFVIADTLAWRARGARSSTQDEVIQRKPLNPWLITPVVIVTVPGYAKVSDRQIGGSGLLVKAPAGTIHDFAVFKVIEKVD